MRIAFMGFGADDLPEVVALSDTPQVGDCIATHKHNAFKPPMAVVTRRTWSLVDENPLLILNLEEYQG